MQLPEAPILFTKPRTALNDPFPSAIVIPKVAQDGTSDYEAELCVVIGKSGRDIKEADALDHVLGYTVSNDVSSRALQLLTTQWCFSKGFDASCPIGKLLRHECQVPEAGVDLSRARPCCTKCCARPTAAEHQNYSQRRSSPRRMYQVKTFLPMTQG
jgi:2-keto-4-pentenoate hydratase/2-oxohepta-3-ene-1,7-dioic acid hydratase in catechol pathway